MKILRSSSLLIAFIMLFSMTAGAVAERIDKRKVVTRDLSGENDVFCDDFNTLTPGKIPPGYSVVYNPAPSEIITKKIIGPYGKPQTVLMVNDAVGGSTYAGPYFRKNFQEVSTGRVAFETNFKLERTGEHTHAGLRFYLMKGSTAKIRLSVSGADDGSLSYNVASGGGVNLTSKKIIEPGVWYRLRVVLDIDTKLANVMLESKALPTGYVYYENLAMYTDTEDASVDNFAMECAQYDCSYYFDYIRVESGANLKNDVPNVKRQRPEPIPAPVSQAPQMRPVPGRYNVSLNGEYMYFAPKPIASDGDLTVTVKSAFRIFSLIEDLGGNGFSASGDIGSVTLKENSAEVVFNGKTTTMASPVQNNDGKYTVLLGEFAKALGYDAVLNEEEQTMYITGGVSDEKTQN